MIPDINISNVDYNLPPERIAQFPLPQRDESKLLVYNQGFLSENVFKKLPHYLDDNGLILFNETKVIRARLGFTKETGAAIEIFCLEPFAPTKEIQQAFLQKSGVVWKCLVGNSKKWKSGKLKLTFNHAKKACSLFAERIEQNSEYSLVKFEWQPENLIFSDVLSETGNVPLPPYMTRKANDSDKERYQTIFAKSEGSVAAPTAGLHFTDEVLEAIEHKNIGIEKVTLHVGAGTFKPVTSESIQMHEMHTEKILVDLDTIKTIRDNLDVQITVVGTTTMRTIESLYWYGIKLIVDDKNPELIDIHQWDPYQAKYQQNIPVREVLEKVIESMELRGQEVLQGQTQLIIVPGYTFRIPDVLITNFHMPKSTLLLLVSAFMGDDWKKVYEYALNNDFRFLSYGDSCLFFKCEND